MFKLCGVKPEEGELVRGSLEKGIVQGRVRVGARRVAGVRVHARAGVRVVVRVRVRIRIRARA